MPPFSHNVPRQDKILSLIGVALPLLQIEIDKNENGIRAVDCVRSLKIIKARLEDMEKMIRTGSVQKDKYYRGLMGRFVVDGWPLNHPLGSKITEIEYEFYRLK